MSSTPPPAATPATPSRSLFVLNTSWNLLGFGLPMAVALLATPLLIHALGTERFGVLVIAWGVIGYFTLFEFGLGGALTQAVSVRRGSARAAEIPAYVWTGLGMMLLLGLLGAVLLLAVSRWLVEGLLNLPVELRGEALAAVRLIALALPLVTSTAGLRGALEAHHYFGAVNAVRIPSGMWTFLAPLAVAPFTLHLGTVVAVLVLGRLLAWLAYLALCLARLPVLREGVRVDGTAARALIGFGGWMTVGGVANTFMVYSDRFLIGAMLPVTAVAYYVTPYDAMHRLTVLPAALLAALFPAFSATLGNGSTRAEPLFGWSIRVVALMMFPPLLTVIAFAGEGLHLWVGAEFALHGIPVLRWMAAGVFLNAFAMVAAGALQASGRPRVTGITNLLELPAYLALLYVLLGSHGIEGAAMAWAIRAGVDAAVLLWLAGRAAPATASAVRLGFGIMASGCIVFALVAAVEPAGGRALALALALGGFVPVALRVLTTPGERMVLRARFGRWRSLAAGRSGA